MSYYYYFCAVANAVVVVAAFFLYFLFNVVMVPIAALLFVGQFDARDHGPHAS
jgi:hypothetical protein